MRLGASPDAVKVVSSGEEHPATASSGRHRTIARNRSGTAGRVSTTPRQMQGRALGMGLVVAGALLVLAGLAVWSGALAWFGRLPGDIRIEGARTRVWFPITSMVLISLLLSAVLWAVGWWLRTRR